MKRSRFFAPFICIGALLLPASQASAWLWKSKKSVIVYGIEKKVYDTLTEDQRKHIIEVHNEHERYQEKQKEKRQELLKKIETLEEQNHQLIHLKNDNQMLEARIEKLQKQIDSQEKALGNFLEISQDLLNARNKGKNYAPGEKREKFYPKIAKIHRGFNATTVELDNETKIEISPFEKEKIDVWMNGQSVELTKGDGLVYVLILKNLDTENSVSAKIKE